MKHLHNAHAAVANILSNSADNHSKSDYICVDGSRVAIMIQDGPIGEVGVNGIQVTDMLEYIKEVYKSLNHAFPCRENSITITKIEEAIHWQDARTKDRENRGVEGLSAE
jgi:hypothetical protein